MHAIGPIRAGSGALVFGQSHEEVGARENMSVSKLGERVSTILARQEQAPATEAEVPSR